MSENEQNEQNEQNEEGGEKAITLDAETYQAILDKLDEADEIIKGKGSKKTGDPVKDLADEAKGGKTERKEEVDLDGLTQTQLTQHIVQEVGKVLEPFSVELQTIKLGMEIDSLTRDEKYAKIFEQYEDDVFKIAGENPRLTLKRACDLALAEHGGKLEEKSEKTDTTKDRSALLKHLPRPDKIPISERPGHNRSGLENKQDMDRKSAAAKAIDDIGVKFDF